MRGGKSGSLKGKNKWVRPDGGHNSAPVQPDPPQKPKPADVGHEQPALKKVGKFALARNPAPQKPSRPAQPAIKPILKPPPASPRARFRYERPKDSAAAAAAPPPLLPSTKTTAGSAKLKVKSVVRPGKLRWNKYVRQSVGGEETEKQSIAAASAAPPSPLKNPPPAAPGPATASASLSAGELQLRRRSKRISAASELVRKHQGRNVPQRTQRAMQLLRLGGQFYSIVGRKGKGRSLKLQSYPTSTAPIPSPSQNQAILKPKPKLRSFAAAAPNPAAPRASGSKNLASTRSASKIAGLKQTKLMSRLKGGRLVYCPVYCHTGRCPRRGRGCPLRHDPTKRAVCPLWLRNKCSLGGSCPLQHQRRPELMPACVHYLQGRCTNSNCPYLHVDLPPEAPHCAAFLRGYCAAGVACASKHYTLKQIKEERKLVAGKGEKRKKESKQLVSGGDAGDDCEKPKKRKKRRGRYFDYVPSDDEDKNQELEKKEGQGDESSESDGQDQEELSVTSSGNTEEEKEGSDTDAETKNSTDDDDDDEDQPFQKRLRRLTGAPLPDFIGL